MEDLVVAKFLDPMQLGFPGPGGPPPGRGPREAPLLPSPMGDRRRDGGGGRGMGRGGGGRGRGGGGRGMGGGGGGRGGMSRGGGRGRGGGGR